MIFNHSLSASLTLFFAFEMNEKKIVEICDRQIGGSRGPSIDRGKNLKLNKRKSGMKEKDFNLFIIGGGKSRNSFRLFGYKVDICHFSIREEKSYLPACLQFCICSRSDQAGDKNLEPPSML